MIARVAAACLACAWLGASVDPARADTALRVTASLHPASVQYGDPVTAEVEVEFDAQTVEAASIRVQPRFGPYAAAAEPHVQHVHAGAVRFRYTLLCLTEGCLPGNGPRALRLAPVTAFGLAGGRTVTATGSWPALRVSSRLAAADRTGRIRFRYAAAPPAPRYRLAPAGVAAGLIAFAVLCVLAALALAGRGLARRAAARAPGRLLSPLELAIAYVRDSLGRGDLDRRRALELLSEAAGGELSADAAERAWSKRPPTPAGAAELADRAAGAA